MALLKRKEVENKGIFGDYHRIIELRVDYLLHYVFIAVGLYTDENCAKVEGKAPIEQVSFGFQYTPENFPFFAANRLVDDTERKIGYRILKTPKPGEREVLNEQTQEYETQQYETNFYADAVDLNA